MKRIEKYFRLITYPKAYVNKEINKRIENFIAENTLLPINEIWDGDIFIAGYPKSGNTWLQTIISGILYGINTTYLSDKLSQEIIPDVHARKYYKRFGAINFFKTHHLPKPEYKNVIHLVRDGRDSMVSYFYMNKILGKNYTLKDMIVDGNGLFPSKWHTHTKAWLENPYNANIITIRYEDLHFQPIKALKEICRFTNLERSDQILSEIITGSTIENMRKRVEETGGMGHSDWEGKKGVLFFREGRIGDYKTTIPADLIDYFNKESETELKHLGYSI